MGVCECVPVYMNEYLSLKGCGSGSFIFTCSYGQVRKGGGEADMTAFELAGHGFTKGEEKTNKEYRYRICKQTPT